MDGISLHLPPVIPDSYYDISTHGSGYQPFQTTSAWVTRDDGNRGYHQAQTNEYETSLRFPGNVDRRECTAVGSGEGIETADTDEPPESNRGPGELMLTTLLIYSNIHK